MAHIDPRRPAYFLAWATEIGHTGQGFQECAMVIAPKTIPRERMGPDTQHILRYADEIAQQTAHRLLFFAELTATLTADSQSWAERGVDWEAALTELETFPIAALHLSLTYQAWAVLANAARQLTIHYPDGSVTLNLAVERDKLRDAILPGIAKDWSNYMDGILRQRL